MDREAACFGSTSMIDTFLICEVVVALLTHVVVDILASWRHAAQLIVLRSAWIQHRSAQTIRMLIDGNTFPNRCRIFRRSHCSLTSFRTCGLRDRWLSLRSTRLRAYYTRCCSRARSWWLTSSWTSVRWIFGNRLLLGTCVLLVNILRFCNKCVIIWEVLRVRRS